MVGGIWKMSRNMIGGEFSHLNMKHNPTRKRDAYIRSYGFLSKGNIKATSTRVPSRRRLIFSLLIFWTFSSLVLFFYHIGKQYLHNYKIELLDQNQIANEILFGNNFVIKRTGEENIDFSQEQNDTLAEAPELVRAVINKNLPGLSYAEKIEVVNNVMKAPNFVFKNKAKGPYGHDLHYLQYMKCPTTLRHKLAKSKNLKGKYIADVPVLLTPEHVTTAEHKRLRKYRDLMGWKYAKYRAISDAMSLLNTPNNQYLFDDLLTNNTLDEAGRSRCIRCAVVGNGGILNGSRMGHVIDSHDYVFRTNVALTDGYEKDVGIKTSFYCFGMKTLSNSVYYMKDEYDFRHPPWTPGMRYIFLAEDDWAFKYISAALKQKSLPKGRNERYAKREPFTFQKPLAAEDIKVVHPDFCRYVDQSWLRSPRLRKQGRATTGAIMIFLALHTCDEVNAFGFMGNPKKYSSHYYDRTFVKSDLTAVAWHDWDAENKLWKLLIDEDVLTVYTKS